MVVRIADGGGAYVVDTVVFGEDLAALVKRRLPDGYRKIGLFDEEREKLCGREHPDELPGRVLHRKRRLAGLFERPKRVDKRLTGVDHGDRRIDEIPDSHIDVALRPDALEMKMLEHPLCTRRKSPRAYRLDVAHPGAPPQVGKRIRAHDRVDVRIPVSTDVCFHSRRFLASVSTHIIPKRAAAPQSEFNPLKFSQDFRGLEA